MSTIFCSIASNRPRFELAGYSPTIGTLRTQIEADLFVMQALSVGQSVLKESIVVHDIRMLYLEPDPRHVDRVDMGWKSPMHAIDLLANVAGAANHVFAIGLSFF